MVHCALSSTWPVYRPKRPPQWCCWCTNKYFWADFSLLPTPPAPRGSLQVGVCLRRTVRKLNRSDCNLRFNSSTVVLVLQNNQPLLCVEWIRNILFWSFEYGSFCTILICPMPPGTVGYSTNEPGCNHLKKLPPIIVKQIPSLFVSPKIFQVDFHTVHCCWRIVPELRMSRCGWGSFSHKPSPSHSTIHKFT